MHQTRFYIHILLVKVSLAVFIAISLWIPSLSTYGPSAHNNSAGYIPNDDTGIPFDEVPWQRIEHWSSRNSIERPPQ